MSILQKHLAFVKDQVTFQTRMLDRFGSDSYRVKLHSESRQKFESLLADLESADKALDNAQSRPVPAQGQLRLTLSPEEIEGLPEDVLNELSISEGDKTEYAILSLIEDAGGIISLDRLIVGLFRKTGEKIKRQTMTSRLYRMAQKDMVFSVPTKKGVYSNRAISEEEALKLFSGDRIN
ncbi:MAG: hypothetical protein GC166_09760 [Alphaproteobacteria bacterium]|nr:hypothetical protein [Alphaproteobacteria bacterium]